MHNTFDISAALHRETPTFTLLVDGCADSKILCVPPVWMTLVAIARAGQE